MPVMVELGIGENNIYTGERPHRKGYLEGKTGSLFGIPFGSETSILGYRKDIFDKHGLKVPETYDEMLETACKIPELEPGMGGLSSRAASGHHASHAFLLHLAPLGGRVEVVFGVASEQNHAEVVALLDVDRMHQHHLNDKIQLLKRRRSIFFLHHVRLE